MTNFAKARWETNGNDLHLGMEFSKVDKQRRMVAGWATIDNVDTEGDIVTAEASLDAFARSRRNLREMHKKDSAVGKIVSYKEDTFTAPDGTKHRGIFVKVRVSEGAQDTWLKVLDGTLSGFSIGGAILEAEEIFQKDSGQTLRKVTKYDLNELSLVDNPGNQYSDITNVFKFKKSADGSVTSLSGMVEEQKILNVFYCSEDEISKEAPSDSYDCPVCDNEMNVVGFIEDGADRGEKVSTLVTKFKTNGGVSMEKVKKNEEELETVETGHEAGDPTEVPTPAKTDEAVDVDEVGTEETPAADVEEVHDESEEIAKRLDTLKTDIADILNKNNKDTAEKIEALEKVVGETRNLLDEKFSELDKKYANLNTDLETTKSRQVELESKLSKINSSGAFRKSADLDNDSAETVQKSNTSDWNGAFSVENLFG
jgi:phage head maturation protease